MRFTADPRCPEHYAYEAHLQVTTSILLPATWRCSVCGRPLGAASAGSMLDGGFGARRRRRPGPLSGRWSDAIDWDWFTPDDVDDDETDDGGDA
jgi:hypothetical protein